MPSSIAPGPRLTRLAQTLPATVPFVGPEAQERAMGHPFTARLGANENVFGPSPKAIAAMEKAASEIWMYGDPESHDLRHALAAHHGVKPENIMVGEGIDGLLGYLARLTVEEGDSVVTSEGAYPTFNYHVAGFGGTLVKLPYHDDREDLPALLDKAAETGAKLVYFANPDNPMASYTPGADITVQLDRIPDGTLLALDEAYVEFAPAEAVPEIDINDPRVIRFRTFSKAYGMAGARVGYALAAEPLITAFHKIRNHFGMNRAAQAGALAALADQPYLAQTIADVAHAREEITRIAAANGLKALPSATNFVAIDCGAGAELAGQLLKELVARGIFVRMPFAAPGNRCIRLSCGRPRDLAAFEAALPEALAAARDAVG
ncbi:pyridoxal phosphate-dependent aminotransferase [Rhodalgimonas zhirmunskyi]|uniref:histidinol-phosphate transaminase n=1 Tax=Rhodalgimonas zhirmunskyi TaxID=2964767 RepID=A0AAJ1UG92_9RHOB|nr:pyridoxal phosphate-dependent aminotransferase [Rhodoalgimonas zhirmunskyi]MDQ2095592.1 pyridoxal phosphate-dependent aminotransferase [Rhodoalgimonas zhirmunskyi]